ncbi:uncharacterized protein TRAVEDRAFT_98306, partial [Trametes versicolor FP-101664 SS1]|uniref:uncharacterized protein n=1 Tax=Trametes versicolor (strain FP-101664) TaxID=717944 RepID=UPI00046224D9
VYSQKLYSAGYGYPLWDGNPQDGNRQLELGVVGHLKYGRFWELFNTMKPDDPEHQKNGVPPEFKVFELPDTFITKPFERLRAEVISSESVAQIRMEASASAGVPGLEDLGSAGVGYKFVTKSKTGAFLLLDTPGIAIYISNKNRVSAYLREHFEHWFDFANHTRGLDLKPSEIFFVSGTTKTTRWACSAFEGSSRQKTGFLNAQVLSIGSVDMSMSISAEDAVRKESNYGPSSMGPPVRAANFPAHELDRKGTAAADLPYNQCIFFHYYKVRRR